MAREAMTSRTELSGRDARMLYGGNHPRRSADPFCAYDSVSYREQVWAQMTGVAVPDIVPNASPLQPILADSPHGSKLARDVHPPGTATDTINFGHRVVPR